MATSKLNKEQYANIGSFAGIMLVYNSTNKDGELVQTAQHFFGADFEPADKSDNEIFRVIKNMVATMWHTIAEEKKLRTQAYKTGMHEEAFRLQLDELMENIKGK